MKVQDFISMHFYSIESMRNRITYKAGNNKHNWIFGVTSFHEVVSVRVSTSIIEELSMKAAAGLQLSSELNGKCLIKWKIPLLSKLVA